MSYTPHLSPAHADAPGTRARGAIHQGYTGDKLPGSDPAAVPLS